MGIDLTADDKVEQYDLYVRDDSVTPKKILHHTGWVDATEMGTKDLTLVPLNIALSVPKNGPHTLVIIGVAGPVEPPPRFHPAQGSKQFFWATSLNAMGNQEIKAELLHVPTDPAGDNDDADHDLFPDAIPWVAHVPAALTIDAMLLDCDDKTTVLNNEGKPVSPDKINPFADEICGDGIDENCDGNADEVCVDSDNDGDPDTTDCKPMDPTIHHPITDPKNPHYDPFPQSQNCCGYSLGKSGAEANMSFDADKICHKGTCGDGIDQDCRANGDPSGDVACSNDQDCDGFPAMDPQNDGCKAPPNKPSGSDCDDCDPTIHPGAPEICDGKDNNCNGLTDETCVGCDLDGDGYQRKDAQSGCPDMNDKHPGKVDCNDEDSGVYPGSTALTGNMEGGTVLGALRGLCRNRSPDGSPQDADCDGEVDGCPGEVLVMGKMVPCDADGDGFIDVKLAQQCDPTGKLPRDCNDADPHIYPGAPDRCGDGIAQNCFQDEPCNGDKDGDKYLAPDDCDDNNPAIHPWATEVCDGIDNDCDGLTDELNPDATGMAMIANGAVIHCTDSNVGLCAGDPMHLGDCICSGSSVSNLHFDPKRTACPGETPAIDAQMGGKDARCYFAIQCAP